MKCVFVHIVRFLLCFILNILLCAIMSSFRKSGHIFIYHAHFHCQASKAKQMARKKAKPVISVAFNQDTIVWCLCSCFWPSMLWLVSKMTRLYLFACKTNRIVARSSKRSKQSCMLSQPALGIRALCSQAKNVFLPHDSTRVTCKNTLLNDSDDRCFVSQTCFHCQYYCDSLCVQFVTYVICVV